MTNKYHPHRNLGIYSCREDLHIVPGVQLERVVVAAKYAHTKGDELVRHARRRAQQYLSKMTSSEKVFELMENIPNVLLQRICEDREYAQRFREFGVSNNKQELQIKIGLMPTDEVEEFEEENYDAKYYGDYLTSGHSLLRRGFGEIERILITLDKWRLPSKKKLEMLLDDNVINSRTLHIISTHNQVYPYSVTEEVVKEVMALNSTDRQWIKQLHDLSLDLADEYFLIAMQRIAMEDLNKNRGGISILLSRSSPAAQGRQEQRQQRGTRGHSSIFTFGNSHKGDPDGMVN